MVVEQRSRLSDRCGEDIHEDQLPVARSSAVELGSCHDADESDVGSYWLSQGRLPTVTMVVEQRSRLSDRCGEDIHEDQWPVARSSVVELGSWHDDDKSDVGDGHLDSRSSVRNLNKVQDDRRMGMQSKIVVGVGVGVRDDRGNIRDRYPPRKSGGFFVVTSAAMEFISCNAGGCGGMVVKASSRQDSRLVVELVSCHEGGLRPLMPWSQGRGLLTGEMHCGLSLGGEVAAN